MWQGQLQGTVEALRNEIRTTNRNLDLFSSLWLKWTESYFTYTKNLNGLSDEQKKVLITTGKERTQNMLSQFKKEMQSQKPRLIEILLADYLMDSEE